MSASRASLVAFTAVSLLYPACSVEAEHSTSTEQPYLVSDSPLGATPGVTYRLGGRNECTRDMDREPLVTKLKSAGNLAVARIQVIEECSRLGGNHVFAETELVLRGESRKSLHTGGHGCPTWTIGDSKPYESFEAYAVVAYRAIPQEELNGGSAWCIPSHRDGNIDAMVIFDQREKAIAFAYALAP